MVVLAIKVLQVHNLQDVEDVRNWNGEHDEGSYKNDDDQDDLDAMRKNEGLKGWSFSHVIKEGNCLSP